jgi:hypothetical protein
MSITYAEKLTDTTTAPDGVPQMLFNHFVAGPGQAIAGRAADESVLTAVRDYLVDAWDNGCARLYNDSRDMVLVECAMPQISNGSIADQCESLLAATLREELGPEWISGPGVRLMASQLFTGIRLVMDEMRRQIIAASSLDEASAAIRAVVAEVFDHLEHGLGGVGVRRMAEAG